MYKTSSSSIAAVFAAVKVIWLALSTLAIVPSTASSAAWITSPATNPNVASTSATVIMVCVPAPKLASFTVSPDLKSKAPAAIPAT